MAPDTVGTLMASTHYVWYGKISATMTSSQGQGVVTAFIMMSDVRDEIDFEFVGTDTEHVQTNFYSQGVTNCKSKFYLQVASGHCDAATAIDGNRYSFTRNQHCSLSGDFNKQIAKK